MKDLEPTRQMLMAKLVEMRERTPPAQELLATIILALADICRAIPNHTEPS